MAKKSKKPKDTIPPPPDLVYGVIDQHNPSGVALYPNDAQVIMGEYNWAMGTPDSVDVLVYKLVGKATIRRNNTVTITERTDK